MGEKKSILVLGVVGSPRKNGNTEILVDEILKGAAEAGAQTQKIRLEELTIAPCRACYGCQQTGECVQKDDMLDLLDKMKRSHIWVLGTPVYWWGPSAQLKAFVDRWFSKAASGQTEETFGGKLEILAIAMGDRDPRTGRHIVGMFSDALD